MRVSQVLLSALVVGCLFFPVQALWVPETIAAQPDMPVPGTASNYNWVDIPEVGSLVEPRVSINEQQKGAKSATLSLLSIPHDVSCNLEYGYLHHTQDFGFGSARETFGSVFAGKAEYAYWPDDVSAFGGALYDEGVVFAKDTFGSVSSGSNFFLISGFYKREYLQHIHASARLNVNWQAGKGFVKTSINPLLTGVYSENVGPIDWNAGFFVGYAIALIDKKGYSTFPYALLGSVDYQATEKINAHVDLAVSHEFIVIGASSSISVSEKFVLVPGIKWPKVFMPKSANSTNKTSLAMLRITLGASTRF